VRRAYSQAQPILADLIGSLEGEPRQELSGSVEGVTKLISAGKFSQAWRYPELIQNGQQLYEEQSRHKAQAQRAQRAVDAARRRATDLLRDSEVNLTQDTAARLNRELRSATTLDAVSEASERVKEAIASARATQEKRRDREIDRTRARIRRSPAGAEVDGPADSWQDVLLRLRQQMTDEEAGQPARAE